jgi:uncharacterized membrane protein
MSKTRIVGLDIFRGWAILFMITYHFTFDLNHFHFISVDMNHTVAFLIARYSIMSMFLLGVGISLALAHQQFIKWKGIRKRVLQLGIASVLVSIATYVEFPHSWVYFGILHFILLASILTLPFLFFPRVTFISAIVILIGSATNLLHTHGIFAFLQPLLNLPPLYAEDLVPLTPWFSVVLFGTLIVHYEIHEKIFRHNFFKEALSLNKILKFMGQHSLIIYLSHQPILFFAFDTFFKFFSTQ